MARLSTARQWFSRSPKRLEALGGEAARLPAILIRNQPGEVLGQQLARVEQIKKYKIVPEEWEPGGDELTPTMKLKRKPIHEKYAEEIEALYAG